MTYLRNEFSHSLDPILTVTWSAKCLEFEGSHHDERNVSLWCREL
jgi:hypothetical protein